MKERETDHLQTSLWEDNKKIPPPEIQAKSYWVSKKKVENFRRKSTPLYPQTKESLPKGIQNQDHRVLRERWCQSPDDWQETEEATGWFSSKYTQEIWIRKPTQGPALFPVLQTLSLLGYTPNNAGQRYLHVQSPWKTLALLWIGWNNYIWSQIQALRDLQRRLLAAL